MNHEMMLHGHASLLHEINARHKQRLATSLYISLKLSNTYIALFVGIEMIHMLGFQTIESAYHMYTIYTELVEEGIYSFPAT